MAKFQSTLSCFTRSASSVAKNGYMCYPYVRFAHSCVNNPYIDKARDLILLQIP